MPPGTVATIQNLKKKKKKKRQSASPNFHGRWIVKKVIWIVYKHGSGIAAFYIVNRNRKRLTTFPSLKNIPVYRIIWLEVFTYESSNSVKYTMNV